MKSRKPTLASSAVAEISSSPPDAGNIPLSVHDAITRPAHLPPEPPIGFPAVVATPLPAPPRMKSSTLAPVLDDVDTGWDMGEDDPTSISDAPPSETESTPSSTEMAGDGSVEGDGLDQVD